MDYSKFDKLTNESSENLIESSLVNNLLPEIHRNPLEKISDLLVNSPKAKVILIGEASHGTKDFYDFRGDVTMELIRKGLCQSVLIEGDFPDTASLHNYVMGYSNEKKPPLEKFERFPSWMWGNKSMEDFLIQLRNHNLASAPRQRVGIFGMDVYSMHDSMKLVLEYLKEKDLEAYEKCLESFSCFERFGDDPQMYGLITSKNLALGCEKAAAQGVKLVTESASRPSSPLPQADVVKMTKEVEDGERELSELRELDRAFFADSNARVVEDAEKYYRSMFDPQTSSWNVRVSITCWQRKIL